MASSPHICSLHISLSHEKQLSLKLLAWAAIGCRSRGLSLILHGYDIRIDGLELDVLLSFLVHVVMAASLSNR